MNAPAAMNAVARPSASAPSVGRTCRCATVSAHTVIVAAAMRTTVAESGSSPVRSPIFDRIMPPAWPSAPSRPATMPSRSEPSACFARAKHAEGSERLGIVAGLLGALGQAGGMILSKIGLRTGLDPLSATVVRIAAATITVWALTVAQRQVRPTLGALADGRATAFMAAGAFMGPFLGVTLALTSLYYIEAGVSASITALSPLVAMLLAARFHGERLTWRAIAGAVVAIAGVVILFRR